MALYNNRTIALNVLSYAGNRPAQLLKKQTMRSFLFTFICIAAFASCAQTQGTAVGIKPGIPSPASAHEAVATFAEGCFWHAEIVFQSLAGVRDAVSGYAGGKDKHPSYESVCSGETGHAESVQVYYDSTVISYRELVQAFFASQDPTSVNRQGNDVGTQYRSVAFYRNGNEKQIIESEIQKLEASKKYAGRIATSVVPYTTFYTAEDYHQEYILHHPGNSYVQYVSIPDFESFKKSFKGNFKKD